MLIINIFFEHGAGEFPTLQRCDESSISYALGKLTDEAMMKHQIKMVPLSGLDRLNPQFRIKLPSVCRRGTIANYKVGFGRYRIYVRLLNLPTIKDRPKKIVGEGAYGSIMEQDLASTKFVAKVMFLRVDPQSI